jgi:hypothetical protein
MAASVCRICKEPIGYGRCFYRDYQVGADPRVKLYVHSACLEDEIAAQRRTDVDRHVPVTQ